MHDARPGRYCNCILFGYDSFGRLISRRWLDDCAPGSAGIREQLARDSAGRLVERTLVAEDGVTVTRATSWTYGGAGRLATLWDSATPGAFRSFGWDARGLLVEQLDEFGQRTELLYDALGQSSGVRRYRDATSFEELIWQRDLRGNIAAAIDAAGRSTTYEHDDLGRLVTVVSPDSGTTRLSYDEGGNLAAVRTAAGSPDERFSTFAYDGVGRLTAVDHGGASCSATGVPGASKSPARPTRCRNPKA
jgi:YD repeat-containing protein